MLASGSACPSEKTLRQREKYFSDVKSLGIKQLLEQAANEQFVKAEVVLAAYKNACCQK
jgi:hypothetical protein